MRDLSRGRGQARRRGQGRRRGRPLLSRARRDERGVVGVLVGLLLGTVLLAVAALAIDVGQLYSERAQLQNGADAAALAVAQACATGTCTASSAQSIAVTYASENAQDGAAGVSLVCGSGALGACPASTGAMTDCPAAPPAGTNYVDVHTSTRTSGGATVVTPIFAKAMLGNGNYQGTTVYACAQAEWGGPAAAQTVAFTISACTWDQATDDGTDFAQPPPYPPDTAPSASLDQQLTQFWWWNSGFGCAGEGPGYGDAPGLFGWTSDPGNDCSLYINGSTYTGTDFTWMSSACQSALAADVANRTVVYVPVYSSVSYDWSGGTLDYTYTLKGFAAFVVTGFSTWNDYQTDWLNPGNFCWGWWWFSTCIEGYFTQKLIPSASLGGINLGATAVKITG